MKRYQAGIGAIALLGSCLAIPSCEELSKPLAGGDMLMSPALPPSGMGTRMSGRSFHAVHVGMATARQRSLAETRAQAALQSARVKNSVQQKKVRYVAVPVAREKTQKSVAGTTVMKVNVDTGVPTGDVYVAQDKGTAKDGDTIRLGGDPTLFFATTGDRL